MQNATLAKLGITAMVALGGLGFLAYSSTAQAAHYMMVDELVDRGLDRWTDTELKVHGWVAPGTLVRAVVNQEMQQTFVLEKAGKRIRVFSKGPVPDTFKDGAEVVATGRLAAPGPLQQATEAMCATGAAGCPVHAGAEHAWVLEATEISAKCASHYGADANRTKREPVFQ
jgi:cytochrome c-type biogenesis protein CcmE